MQGHKIPIGTKYGHWTVVSESLQLSMAGHSSHLCECLCGSREFIPHFKLVRNNYPHCSECKTFKREKNDR